MRRLLCTAPLLALLATACGTPAPPVVRYVITSESEALCCRTLAYRVETAPSIPVKNEGDSVSVAIGSAGSATVGGRCDTDLEFPVTITNGSERDIYVPFGTDLQGARLMLYPWRELAGHAGAQPLRLARQIQQGDRVGGTGGTETRFVRIGARHALHLTGVIPRRWMCIVPEPVDSFYLSAELNPRYYIDRLRGFRLRSPSESERLPQEYQIAYEIAWTPLDYLDGVPVLRRTTSTTGDSVGMLLGVREEPGVPLNSSQELARSNVLRVMLTPQ